MSERDLDNLIQHHDDQCELADDIDTTVADVELSWGYKAERYAPSYEGNKS